MTVMNNCNIHPPTGHDRDSSLRASMHCRERFSASWLRIGSFRRMTIECTERAAKSAGTLGVVSHKAIITTQRTTCRWSWPCLSVPTVKRSSAIRVVASAAALATVSRFVAAADSRLIVLGRCNRIWVLLQHVLVCKEKLDGHILKTSVEHARPKWCTECAVQLAAIEFTRNLLLPAIEFQSEGFRVDWITSAGGRIFCPQNSPYFTGVSSIYRARMIVEVKRRMASLDIWIM